MELQNSLPCALLVLIVCLVGLQAAEVDKKGYYESFVLGAFMRALESLDVRGQELPKTEVLEELKVYSQSSDPSLLSVLLDPMDEIDEAISKLTNLLKLSTEFCFSESRIEKFNEELKLTHTESEVAYGLLEGVLEDQLRLCEKEFREEFVNYKSTRPNDWGLIRDLQRCKIDTLYPEEETFGTRMMAKLLEMRLPESEQQSEKLAEEARKVADDTMEACRGFEEKFRSHVSSVDILKAMFDEHRPPRGTSYMMNLVSCWYACRYVLEADNEAAIIRAVDTRCNVFQEPIDKFRAKYPQGWLLISELSSNFRKRNFSPLYVKFKQAKQELLRKRLQEGEKLKSRTKMRRRAEAVAQDVESACMNFEIELKPMLERAPHSVLPVAIQLLEIKEVCLNWSLNLPETIEETVNYLLPPQKWSLPCCKA